MEKRHKYKYKADNIERGVLKRLKKSERVIRDKKIKKPSTYIKASNRLFSKTALNLSRQDYLRNLNRDLLKSNIAILFPSYISVILFTTLLSFLFSILVFFFFLFFNVGAELPIVTIYEGGFLIRFLKTFWIMLAIPLVTLLFMYFYPSLEKKSLETKINQELPFVTIHMAAVAGSQIEPSKIFQIIIATKDYPNIEKEFTKLINEINIYGYDLVTALRTAASKSPSKKLTELYNSLATTITSGGTLNEFFKKRSETLLFEYRLDREKYTRLAETFMDIYISVVIAAPMILMLLLILISVSGLGLGIGTGSITLIMILIVSFINVVFLILLNLRQPMA